jgi:hypothetical protein
VKRLLIVVLAIFAIGQGPLIGTAALFGAAGVAHADSDVPHACQALLHQPQTAFDGPNQAVQELERTYGLDANHAEALVDQLIVLNRDDPAGWRTQPDLL